jgi:ferredoxin-NADP reductase
MRYIPLTLERVEQSGEGASEFVFRPARPLPHRAGQFGLLVVPGAGVRPFTFASDARSDLLSIATSLRSASTFKQGLSGLRPGDRVHVAGAMGSLPVPTTGRHQVLVAQGIGITPFLSMARSYLQLDATLLQVGGRQYFDETARAMSSAEHLDHHEDLHGAIDRAVADHPGARWSLSGRSAFVNAVAGRLLAAGARKEQIHKDAFWTMRPVRAHEHGTAPATA